MICGEHKPDIISLYSLITRFNNNDTYNNIQHDAKIKELVALLLPYYFII